MNHQKTHIRGSHIVIKTLWQIFIVLIEVLSITSVFVYASHFFLPIQDRYDAIGRYIASIAVYEIFVYIALTFVNDARQDALLALRTAFEQALLYCETGSDFVKEELLDKIDKQLKGDIFNHLDIRKEYENLIHHIETKNELAIKYMLLIINHNYEACNLRWKLTFLLYLFK